MDIGKIDGAEGFGGLGANVLERLVHNAVSSASDCVVKRNSVLGGQDDAEVAPGPKPNGTPHSNPVCGDPMGSPN